MSSSPYLFCEVSDEDFSRRHPGVESNIDELHEVLEGDEWEFAEVRIGGGYFPSVMVDGRPKYWWDSDDGWLKFHINAEFRRV